MNFEQAVGLITALWQEAYTTKQRSPTPIILLGPPGIGKSASPEVARNRLQLWLEQEHPEDGRTIHFDKLDLSSQLPEDLGGLPKTVNDPTHGMTVTSFAVQKRLAPFCKPDALGILVFDDITQATPSVQVAARQSVLDYALGDYKLSNGVLIVITGNRREDKSNATTLPAHFRNSCCLLEMQAPRITDWLIWYGQQKYCDPIVGSYLNYSSKNFSCLPVDADAKGQFATPRTWHKLGRMLKAAEMSGNVHECAQGLVGEGPSYEFLAFRNLRKELNIDPIQLMKDPEGTLPNPGTLNQADKVHAVISNLSERASELAQNAGDPKERAQIMFRYLRALSWATRGNGHSSNEEYISLGLRVFLINGGHVKMLREGATVNKNDSLIQAMQAFLLKGQNMKALLQGSSRG